MAKRSRRFYDGPKQIYKLSDGSKCEITWLLTRGKPATDRLTYQACRIVDGVVVWGQIFTPDPEIRVASHEAAGLVAKMKAEPSRFDKRRLHCVKCGAGEANRCEHPAPYTDWSQTAAG